MGIEGISFRVLRLDLFCLEAGSGGRRSNSRYVDAVAVKILIDVLEIESWDMMLE